MPKLTPSKLFLKDLERMKSDKQLLKKIVKTLAFLETAAPGATVRRPTLRVDYDESIAPVARPPARGLLFPPGAIDGPAAGRDGRD